MSNILPSARMLDGMLHFKEEDGFSRARKLGAFHLEHPRGWDFRPASPWPRAIIWNPR